MKNQMFKYVFAVVASAIASNLSISAFDFNDGALFYNIVSEEDHTCEVAGYFWGIVEANVPDRVNNSDTEYAVVGIGKDAFKNAERLKKINIPNTVTYIETCAFEYCYDLRSVVIPNSVTKIASHAFSQCGGLTNVVLPELLKVIEYGAFNYCDDLLSIKIPESVETIEGAAFSKCRSLTTIEIPSSVQKIERTAFRECIKLSNVVFEHGDLPLIVSNSIFSETAIEELTLGRSLLFENSYGLGDVKPAIIEILDGVDVSDFFTYQQVEDNLQTLIIGKKVVGLPTTMRGYRELSTIRVNDVTPPQCPAFTSNQYMNIKVYVPRGSLSSYLNADGWKDFWNIVEMGTSGRDDIGVESEKDVIGRYDVQGRVVGEDQTGIIVIRYSDGSSRKLLR